MWLLLFDIEVDEEGGGSIKLKELMRTTINKEPISIELEIFKRLSKLKRKLSPNTTALVFRNIMRSVKIKPYSEAKNMN